VRWVTGCSRVLVRRGLVPMGLALYATSACGPSGGAARDAGTKDVNQHESATPLDGSGADGATCAPFVPTADQPHYPVGTDAFDASTFTSDPNGTVTDMSTGLVFETVPADQLTFDQAACRCQTLSLGGATDWRLASRFELDLLVDYVKVIIALTGPAFDPKLFPKAPVDHYWTSTLYDSGNPAQINLPFYVALGDGTAVGASQTGLEVAAGWCVRGGKPTPTEVRFTTTADTVTDTWTKLIWARDVPLSAQAFDHDEAASYCEILVLDGSGGFRIPGVKELQTITAPGQRMPAIDTGLFPATPSLLFHTSATYSPQPSDTWWFVDFTDGAALPTSVYPATSRNAEPVRCVRTMP
jgi:hypothetical protein